MEFKKEIELEKKAVTFLKKGKYHFKWQVPLHNRIIDLVALDTNGNVLGIEFKLWDWKRALIQVKKNKNALDYAFVCVPGGNYIERLKEEASAEGIGVLVYSNEIGTIKIELPAKKITKQWNPNVEIIRNYLLGEE